MKGYCVKHKGMVEVKDGKEVRLKNGRMALKGTCPKDGTTIFRILPKNALKAKKK